MILRKSIQNLSVIWLKLNISFNITAKLYSWQESKFQKEEKAKNFLNFATRQQTENYEISWIHSWRNEVKIMIKYNYVKTITVNIDQKPSDQQFIHH